MYITNTILYIVKKRELHKKAPAGCCLTLTQKTVLLFTVYLWYILTKCIITEVAKEVAIVV